MVTGRGREQVSLSHAHLRRKYASTFSYPNPNGYQTFVLSLSPSSRTVKTGHLAWPDSIHHGLIT